jgi:hypothetical protein
MVLQINNLSHVLYLVTDSLASLGVSLATRPERSDAVWKVLILRSWTFERIEIKLILVWSSANASLVWGWGHLLAFLETWIGYSLGRVSKLVVFSAPDVHRVRLWSVCWTLSWLCSWSEAHLIAVAAGLRSALYLVLNLLLLLNVWVSYLDSLTDLSLLRPIKWIKGLSLTSLVAWRALDVAWIVYIRVVDPIARASLGRAWPVASLSGYPSLGLTCGVANLILRRNISLLLLLENKLLLNLLLVKLLWRCEVEVVYYVGNICNSILLCFRGLNHDTFSILETVLYYLSRLVVARWLIPLMSRTISIKIGISLFA